MRIILIFMLLISPFYSSAQGLLDGYMKGKGNLDIALSGSYESGKDFYRGKELAPLKREITAYNVFAAYGICNSLDLVASLPYISNGGEKEGWQDASFFIRVKLFETEIKSVKARFMLGAGYQLPVSDYVTESAFSIGQQAESKEIRGILQLEKGSYFLMLKGGYNFRNDPNTDAIPLVAKVGIAKETFYADIFLDYLNAQGGSDYAIGKPRPVFQELGVSYLRVGGNFYKPFTKHIGGVVGAAYTLDGRNIGKTVRVSLGIVVKL
jgi:hypothetical protein